MAVLSESPWYQQILQEGEVRGEAQQLCQAWQRYLAQNMPSTNNEILALLARSRGTVKTL